MSILTTRYLCVRSKLLLLTVCLVAAGCSERERVTEPVPSEDDWIQGEGATHTVPDSPDAEIVDAATGERFAFSAGGGTCTVTPLHAGPEVGSNDSAFELEYSGEGSVALLVPMDPDEVDVVLTHLPFDDVIQEGSEIEADGWVPLAVSEGGTGILRVPLIETVGVGRSDASAASTSRFRRIRVRKTDPWAVKMVEFQNNVKLAVDELVSAVGDTRRGQVQERIAGDMAYRVHLRERAKISASALPCYAPFWNDDLRIFLACALMMIDDSGGSVAHETGHYFHHVLVGTETFKTFSARPPGHHVGMVGSKHNLLEDAAYYAEYYLRGSVGGSLSPERGTFISGRGLRPAQTDFLDLEGFGTALLAILTRTDEVIRDFENKQVPVPTVDGEVLDRFHQGFEIWAKGTNSVPDMLGEIEAYLVSNGEQDAKLPAMLEPIGLSYHYACTFVDPEDQGIAGVTVRPVSKVGEDVYVLPVSGPSDADGRIDLPRVFPGSAQLRVYFDGDSTDVGYEIDWTTPTSQVLPFRHVIDPNEPEITSVEVSGTQAVAGRTTIDILGRGFGTEEGRIRFGDVEALALYSGTSNVQWGDTYISCVIPIDAVEKSVRVQTEGGTTSEPFVLDYLTIPEFLDRCKYYGIWCSANYTLVWATSEGPQTETRTNREIGINPYLFTTLAGNGRGYTATTSAAGRAYSINTELQFTGAKPSQYTLSGSYTYTEKREAENPDGTFDTTVISMTFSGLPLENETQFLFESPGADPAGHISSMGITVSYYDHGEGGLVEKTLDSIDYNYLKVHGFSLN